MRISKNNELKVVQFWLTPEEREEKGIMDKVKSYSNKLKEDKTYKTVIYISGKCDLSKKASELLKHNQAV